MSLTAWSTWFKRSSDTDGALLERVVALLFGCESRGSGDLLLALDLWTKGVLVLLPKSSSTPRILAVNMETPMELVLLASGMLFVMSL